MTDARFFGRGRRTAALRLLMLLAGAIAGTGHAQDTYPDRPIRFMVPQPPGGTGDTVSRIVAQRLSARLGKPVVVENKAGAGGTLGASAVAKAPADGYSLVLASPGFATFASMYPSLPFNPASELVPVGMMGSVPITVIVRSEAPYKTLADFVAHAKANPGKATYGSAGQGSLSHLMGAWFKSETGIDVTHVPYSGTAPALTAVVGGHIDILFDSGSGTELLKSGKLRALATTNAKRLPALPSVQTTTELGYPVRGAVWLGVMTTGGTPRPIVERLSRELYAVMQEPEVRQQLEQRGVLADPMTADEFARFFANETRVWSKLVRDNGIRAE
jgi:tripartite-type tricarboxylate transporter receptor subunit TctC